MEPSGSLQASNRTALPLHKRCCLYSSIGLHFAGPCVEDKTCCGHRPPAVITDVWTELEHRCYICWYINCVLTEHRILAQELEQV